MRVFLDANVLISAYFTHTVAYELQQRVLAEHDLVLGLFVAVETERVLTTKMKAPPEQVSLYLSDLKNRAAHMEPVPTDMAPRGLRDPNDDAVLLSALRGGADVLVTRDKDLLDEAARFAGEIVILSPRGFLEWVREEES
ncbi:MAG: putative toxin-antitoxin system toxin component, PIN family [Rhodothermales bacterium]|nr:putative toxin-antitoxin system toxin component, PIN family [Rhodothermales bacterium]